jgi:hypothetical protein
VSGNYSQSLKHHPCRRYIANGISRQAGRVNGLSDVIVTEDYPSTPGTGQCPLTNIKITAQFEAIEPRTIAVIVIFSSVEFYRP